MEVRTSHPVMDLYRQSPLVQAIWLDLWIPVCPAGIQLLDFQYLWNWIESEQHYNININCVMDLLNRKRKKNNIHTRSQRISLKLNNTHARSSRMIISIKELHAALDWLYLLKNLERVTYRALPPQNLWISNKNKNIISFLKCNIKNTKVISYPLHKSLKVISLWVYFTLILINLLFNVTICFL